MRSRRKSDREMSKGRTPEPLDFFIWTVEDVGLWLEEINLGSYRQVFEDNSVNGEYLESLSMFTTEQILRFIRRCHMKWGDFITLCKELRRIKGTIEASPTANPAAIMEAAEISGFIALSREVLASAVSLEDSQLFQWLEVYCSCMPEGGTRSSQAMVGPVMPISSVCKGGQTK